MSFFEVVYSCHDAMFCVPVWLCLFLPSTFSSLLFPCHGSSFHFLLRLSRPFIKGPSLHPHNLSSLNLSFHSLLHLLHLQFLHPSSPPPQPPPPTLSPHQIPIFLFH